MAVIDLNSGKVAEDQAAPPRLAVQNQAPSERIGGVIDLDTGQFASEQPAIQPGQPAQQIEPGVADFVTGSQRIEQTPELGTLPEFGVTEEGDVPRIALGLLSTFDPKAQQDMIQQAIPEVVFETTPDGSTIIEVPTKEGGTRRSVLNKPGLSPQDLTTATAQVLSFIPVARMANLGKTLLQKFGIGAVGAGATEQGLQEVGVALGREERDPTGTAIATATGGAAEVIVPAVQALRSGRRAASVGAERGEVEKVVESIKPVTEAVEGLEAATGQRVGLFRAQQTQVPSELLKQRILPQLDAGARKAAEALELQNKEVFNATTAMIDAIAPEGSIVSSSKRFREASKLALESVKQRRSKAVSGLYSDALNIGADVDLTSTKSLIDDMLLDAPPGSNFEAVGNKLAKLISGKTKKDEVSLRQLQKAKMSMQDIIDGADGKVVSESIKAEVAKVKRELVKMMSDASPLFRKAEDEFIRLSPAVKELEDSILGQVSKVKDTQLKTIAQSIFDPKTALTDPSAITKAKGIITKVDPGAWDQLLRVEMSRRIGGLESLIDEIPGDFVGNIPGQLRRTLFGNPSQRKALLAGMNPEQKQNFKYLEMVLKRASSGRAAGSPTAAFGEAIEKLRGVSAVFRDAVFRPLSTLQQTGERGIFDRNVKAVSDVMFDPKFKPQMRKLRALDPNSPAAARAFTQLIDSARKPIEEEKEQQQ